MVFRNAKSNILAVTLSLLKKLRIKVNSSTVKQRLESHPDYPSLLAISDCLSDFHIENIAYRASLEEFAATHTDQPLLTYCPDRNGTFYLLEQHTDGTVLLSNENEEMKISSAEFISTCGGILLAVRRTEESAEPDYRDNWLRELMKQLVIPLFTATLIAILLYIYWQQPFSWLRLVLLILKAAGLLISISLLAEKIGYRNPFIPNVCGWIKDADCNNLLHAKAAQPLPWLSWAEIGFAYFAGSFLIVLLLPYLTPLIAWLDIAALPVSVYLIAYQHHTKSWCVLCCAVQGILLLEFIANLLQPGGYILSLMLSADAIIPLVLAFMFPLSIWALLKPVFIKVSFLKPLQQQLKKFKSDPDLFRHMLTSQEYHFINDELMPVLLGDRKAKTVITIISNPFCEPCSTAHLMLDAWMQQNNQLSLRLIFVQDNKEGDTKSQVARHMIALGLMEDTKTVQEALTDWFKQTRKDYTSWARKYPVLIINTAKIAAAKQKEWCIKAGIYYTPTILVNGYPIPEPYQFDDLKYLLQQD
jgi:thiol-disulfide isomerase/thioredoxin